MRGWSHGNPVPSRRRADPKVLVCTLLPLRPNPPVAGLWVPTTLKPRTREAPPTTPFGLPSRSNTTLSVNCELVLIAGGGLETRPEE